MRILFIKPKHIGDSLILTPTIVAAKRAYPNAEIWVIVRRGCEKILAGCPEINRIFTLAGVEKSDRTVGDFWREIGIFWKLRQVWFDYVFELGDGHRARFFAKCARTSRRYSVKPSSLLKKRDLLYFTGISTFDWQTCHRVEKDFYSTAEFLPLSESIPNLRFDFSHIQRWERTSWLTNFCVVQIGTRQTCNRWSIENWRAVCVGLLERFEHILITCGPDPLEVKEGGWLEKELGPRVICTRGEASWNQVAELLSRAKLYVGLATATMHLAAACQCPAVALFGPTIEDHWYPWRAPYRIVSENSCLGFTDPEDRFRCIKQRTMEAISPTAVLAACDELSAEMTANT